MKKRFLNLLLVMLMVACVLPMAVSANSWAIEQSCLSSGGHFWNNGVCSGCSKICTHEYIDGICKTCEMTCGHNSTEIIVAVEPQCGVAGSTQGIKCKECEKILLEPQVVSGLMHDYSEFVADVSEATCTQKAVKKYRCKNCDSTATLNKEVGELLPHDLQTSILSDPTCTTTGSKKIWCKNCDTATKYESIPVLGHLEVEIPAEAATCVAAAKTAGVKCGREKCGAILTEPKAYGNGLGHTYSEQVEITEAATCVAKGTATYKCVRCNATESRTDIDPLPHALTSAVLVEPTCTNTGSKKIWCENCNTATKYESIPVLGHLEVEIPAESATCVAAAKTAGVKCGRENCSVILTEPKAYGNGLGHTYSEQVEITEAATCVAKGTATYKCIRCNATESRTDIDPLPHALTSAVLVEPTCTNTGSKKIWCTNNCEQATEYETIPALGHDIQRVENIKDPTCTKTGTAKYECSHENCTEGYTETLEKLNHSMKIVDVFREATCTEIGAKKLACEREGCKHSVLEEIPATGHTEEIIPEVPATCTATGLSEGVKCSVCGEILTPQTVTSMIAHEFTVEVPGKDATCTEDGYTAHTKCAHCDATEGKVEIDTDGHNFVDYICTVCGVRDGSCEHEGASITVQDPTCTAAGKETFSCPTCGYAYEEELEATGHTAQVHSTAGTCVTQGKTWTACSVCGEITVPETATGYGSHNYVNNQCTYCGEVNPDSICRHTGGVTTNTDAPTCTQSGSVTSVCADCGAVVDTEILPATGHSHNNGVCTACGHRDSGKLTFDFQDVFLTEEK